MTGVRGMASSSGTAYGLDVAGENTDWRTRGACSSGQYDVNLWTSPGWKDLQQATWVCLNECEVRRTCLRWANDNRDQVDGCIYGGVLWNRGANGNGTARNRLPRPSTSQPKPLRPTGHPAHTDSPSPSRAVRQSVAVCGTKAGYQRHKRAHEKPCEPCRAVAVAEVIAFRESLKRGPSTAAFDRQDMGAYGSSITRQDVS